MGSIPRLGRSFGEGNGYPLQYSGLEDNMDYTAHGVAKSWSQLSNFHFHSWNKSRLKEGTCLFRFSCLDSIKHTLLLFSRSVISNSLRPHGLEPTQAPLFMGFSRQEYWSDCQCLLLEILLIQDATHVSCTGRRILYC